MSVRSLKALFGVLLLMLLSSVVVAGMERGVMEALLDLGRYPWMRTTLVDLYIGLVVFWCWVAYRESSWPVRLLWAIAIAFTGNLAVLLYLLIRLFQLSPHEGVVELLLRSEHRPALSSERRTP